MTLFMAEFNSVCIIDHYHGEAALKRSVTYKACRNTFFSRSGSQTCLTGSSVQLMSAGGDVAPSAYRSFTAVRFLLQRVHANAD